MADWEVEVVSHVEELLGNAVDAFGSLSISLNEFYAFIESCRELSETLIRGSPEYRRLGGRLWSYCDKIYEVIVRMDDDIDAIKEILYRMSSELDDKGFS